MGRTRTMISRFNSECSTCKGVLRQGTEIVYDYDLRTASHVTCPAVPEVLVFVDASETYARTELLEKTLQARQAEYNDQYNERRVQAKADFLAAGGCEKCGGSRKAVSWSTLDGPGYTEWGTCQACVDKPACPGYEFLSGSTNYNNFPYGVEFRNLDEDYPATTWRMEQLDKEIEDLNVELRGLYGYLTVEKGKVVEVVKGRKVPLGTKGKIFWIGSDRYGTTKIGLKDDSETVHWTALTNVKVVGYSVVRCLTLLRTWV